MRSKIPFLGVSLVIGLTLVAIAGQPARADLYSFDSSNGDPNPGPYGTVSVTGGGNTVTITVSINSSYQINNFGFNVASGTTLDSTTPFSLSLSGGTSTQMDSSGWTWSPVNDSSGVGQQNQGGLDGYGKFSYEITNESATYVTGMTITISGTSLTTSEFEGFSTGSGSKAVNFAAHLKPSGGGTNTYIYGATAIPEPSTMALASLGAVGFLWYGVRRRRKT